MIKSMRMRRECHIVCMVEISTTFWKGIGQSEGLGVNERIILKLILRKECGGVRCSSCDSGQAPVVTSCEHRFHKRGNFFTC
jgi:hypothetical protein